MSSGKPAGRPSRWKAVAWEEMARENPLFAVMTTEDMADAPSTDFSPELVDKLFAKGRRLFGKHVAGPLSCGPDPKDEALVVEYGCGVGRMLKAASEAGWQVAGIDISPTMLEHCRRLAPEAQALYALDEHGRSAMPDEAASAVFSYAVVQHISRLSRYLTAFDEMCRVLKPGGVLAVQLNCTDFEGGFDRPGRTENFETRSLHYRPGEAEPYLSHDQDQWSGVYIGHDLLAAHLEARGVRIDAWRPHKGDKAIAVWLYGTKRRRR